MKKPLLTLALASGLLQGCLSNDSSDATNDSSQLSLAITDAAIDFAAEVNVVIEGIELHSDQGAHTVDFTEARTINLLALQGSESEALLTGETLPAGEYQWLRLKVESANIVLSESGAQMPLTIPSSAQSGFKLVGGFILPANGSADFTLDFDVRKSLTVNAGSGYKLRPTIRMVNNLEVGHIGGSVEGTLCAASSSMAVYAYEGIDATMGDEGSDTAPVASSLVSDAYQYEIGFLTAGDYTVALTCFAAEDDAEVGGDELTFVVSGNVTVDSKQTSIFDLQAQ
ncbi:MAG: DUF4382 domain-containing protein [Bermanella sp.]